MTIERIDIVKRIKTKRGFGIYDYNSLANKPESPTADSLGMVLADPVTSSDNQPVRVGDDGKLYTAPTSSYIVFDEEGSGIAALNDYVPDIVEDINSRTLAAVSFTGNYCDLEDCPVQDTEPVSGSTNMITSGAVYSALESKQDCDSIAPIRNIKILGLF